LFALHCVLPRQYVEQTLQTYLSKLNTNNSTLNNQSKTGDIILDFPLVLKSTVVPWLQILHIALRLHNPAYTTLTTVGMSTPAQDKIIMLRALPTSNRLFWQHKFEEQIGQSVFDRTPDGSNKRELAGNEITTMALNEVAAARERGFFFHVLGRAGWKKGASKPKAGTPGEDEWSRALPQPGCVDLLMDAQRS
jgi:hypothetical protein